MNNKPRRPWVAAILTLIFRGLGHLYSGAPKRGLILFAIEQVLLITFAVIALVIVLNTTFLIIGIIIGFAFTIFCVVDAISIANKNKEAYELAKYNRWFVYVGYVVAFSFLVSMLVSSVVKANLVQAYKIPSGAMIPTLLIGDHIFANKFIYKTTEPKRGDIIIFPFPEDTSRDFVKRLVAVEGDVIEMKLKRFYINGKEQLEHYKIHTDSGGHRDARDNFGP